jgi:ABC-type branched-subunit amino acid transport system substrate-binding protein
MTKNALLRGIAALGLALAWPCAAEPGITPQKVVLGTSLALTGPPSRQGAELLRGLQLGFAQLNAAGGIGGRLVELRAKDDAGVSERTLANTRQLLAEGVIALTGYQGGAAIEPLLALVEQAGVPLIGVASSSELLREPVRPLVFNLRAGVREEAAAIVAQLDAMGITEIAAISQDDPLGRAGREGLRIELARLAMKPVVQAQVPARHDQAAMQRAVGAACKDRPQVVMLLLDAPHALAALRQARQLDCTQQFYVMNEAGAQLLADPALASELSGVIVPQVVPSPAAASPPVVAEFGRLATREGIAPGYAGLEGYLYARIVGEALQRCAREPSRRCLVGALESRPLDLGGYRVQYSGTDHRGSRRVEMTLVAPDGRLRR